MKKTKRFVAYGVLAAMVFGMTGCGSSAPVSDSTVQSQEVEGASESGTGTTELTLWRSMDSVFAEITEKQVDLFNSTIGAEKNIHVTPVFQNWPGTDALTAAMSADDVENMPDVIQLYSDSVSLLRDYDRTVWAEDCLTEDGSLQKEDLVPSARASYSIDGRMIGVPWTASALLLYYNQTYLDQAGVEVPETIEEMASILPVLTEKTDAQYGLNVRVNQYELENWIETQGPEGSEFGNNGNGHNGYITELSCLTNGTLDNFLTQWEKVVESGAYKATKDSMNEEFAQGIHAMVIMTSSRIPTISELVGDSFQWGVAEIPKVSADDIGGAYPSGSGLFMLDRGDEAKKEAAWEFVQFMASPEAQVMWLEGTGYTPVNTKTQELDAYKTSMEEEPRQQVAYDALMRGGEQVIPAFVPNGSTMDTVIKDAMVAFGEGSATKDETFQTIQEGCEKAISDYYRVNPIEE